MMKKACYQELACFTCITFGIAETLPAVFGLFFYGYSFGQNAIRKDLINVKDDVVTSIESSVLYDNANNFVELANHANKKQLENAKGVLYNIGEGFECTPAAHGKDHFGNEYVRIALGYVGKCNPYSVIQQAVFDDARGIILYEDTKNNAELKKKVKNELKNKKVGIPVYVVDSNIGSFLSRQVLEMDLDNNFKDNTDNKRAVFVSLIGSPNTGGKGLRTAMIVVFTILGAGVLISCKRILF
ncbi:hypothetical protein AX774_g2251 [Zancudomyces culisetae]|uniref:Uncharacterized protein n=1 Tax=Zancudomyces culisetae TaxID=1213189 RepID=A0A1R1PTL7_ZANCU|nr:hypothetical protein AX774_g2251 [Zancudomyces culisetae]|eukprot:OMH84232.1 hypothetical protein AX774_g2251 [Zancudomyces culisetae]